MGGNRSFMVVGSLIRRSASTICVELYTVLYGSFKCWEAGRSRRRVAANENSGKDTAETVSMRAVKLHTVAESPLRVIDSAPLNVSPNPLQSAKTARSCNHC